jgi:hypothetical protein
MPLSRLNAVPEKVSDYPEFSMFGELPAWGFYVRHVDGLLLKNITLSIAEADYRPALVFDDVQNLEIQAITILGDTKDKHIILRDADQVTLDREEGVLRLLKD